MRSEVTLHGEKEDRSAVAGPHLTPRESEVLQLLADGLAVKQVARQLGMSVHTCRGHVRALRSKLDVRSQLAAVVKAARLGLLYPRPGEADGEVEQR